MSEAREIVEQAYELARRDDRRALRELVADDATWEPARKGVWSPCRDGDQIVTTLLWRASAANRLRPGETIDLGDRVLIRLLGRRLERLGGKGFIPRLFQIAVVRDRKIVSMQDYPRREDAFAAAGLKA